MVVGIVRPLCWYYGFVCLLNALSASVAFRREVEEVCVGSSPTESLMQALGILIDQWVSQRVPPGPAKASKYVGVFVGVRFLGISR